jgi:outer membrane protein assembly factor BamA
MTAGRTECALTSQLSPPRTPPEWLCAGIATALALARPLPARAEPPAPAAHDAIEVVGNERTARDVIVEAANVGAGDPLDPAALDGIRQRVMNLKLFEAVDVTVRGSDAMRVLTIRVKERWTLLPIPFVSSSSRGTQGGVFVLETNLFGRNKFAAVGGSYATWRTLAFAVYQDPAVAGSRAMLRAAASYSQTARERRVHDQLVFAIDDTRTDLSLQAGYRITRSLWLSAGWFAMHTRDDSKPDFATMPVAPGYVHGPAITVEYRGADFRMYYDEGLSGIVQLRQARHELGSDRDLVDVTARLQYTRSLLSGQPTSLIVQGVAVDGGRIADARLLGGITGTRGFELQSLWVDQAATVTLEHQIPVFVRGWGIWAANVFVDAGRASLGGDHDSFITPGAGLRLFLPRMNFPALGFDVAYSTEVDNVFISASVGLSM